MNQKQQEGQIVEDAQVKQLQFGTLKVEIYPNSKAAGLGAARAAAKAIAEVAQSRDTVGVIFATGASQLELSTRSPAWPVSRGTKFVAFIWTNTSVFLPITRLPSVVICVKG